MFEDGKTPGSSGRRESGINSRTPRATMYRTPAGGKREGEEGD